MTEPVSEDHFYAVMSKIRDLRIFVLQNKIDAWATRQALITALEMDTRAMLLSGVKREAMEKFDTKARAEANSFIQQVERAEQAKETARRAQIRRLDSDLR